MTTPATIDLPKIIRDTAKEQGVTQAQLAEAGKVSRQTINAWFAGRNQINAASVEAMLNLLGIELVAPKSPCT